MKVKITKAGYPYNEGQFVRVLDRSINQDTFSSLTEVIAMLRCAFFLSDLVNMI